MLSHRAIRLFHRKRLCTFTPSRSVVPTQTGSDLPGLQDKIFHIIFRFRPFELELLGIEPGFF